MIPPALLPGNGSRSLKKQIATLRDCAQIAANQCAKATTEPQRHVLTGKCKRLLAAVDTLQAVIDLGLEDQVREYIKANLEEVAA